jgi:hypothetical protein
MNRRVFVKNTAIAAAGISFAGNRVFASVKQPVQNRLPRWKGFNLLDFFSPLLERYGCGSR